VAKTVVRWMRSPGRDCNDLITADGDGNVVWSSAEDFLAGSEEHVVSLLCRPIPSTANPVKSDTAWETLPEMSVSLCYDGDYRVLFTGLFVASTSNANLDLAIFLNGKEQTGFTYNHEFASSGKNAIKMVVGTFSGRSQYDLFEIKWRRTGSGSITAIGIERSMHVEKVKIEDECSSSSSSSSSA